MDGILYFNNNYFTMKIFFLLFICKLFSKDDDFAVNAKNVNRLFFINNAIGAVSLATLLSNHRASRYLRIGSRIGSLFYFYNQYKHVDKVKLNYHFFHFYFPLVLNSAAFLGEFSYTPGKKLLLSEILLSDFLLKNNTFFRIKKVLALNENSEAKRKEQAEKGRSSLPMEYIDSLLSSFVSLHIPINKEICDINYHHCCYYSRKNILCLEFDEEHKVLISKENQDAIKFYLLTNKGFFVSYILFVQSEKLLANFFKTKNGEKGIGKKFFNWVIYFVRANNAFNWYDFCKLFHLKNIKLFTNKFLNKTALAIYQEQGFKIIKEEKDGGVELELQLTPLESQQVYDFGFNKRMFLNNESEILEGDCFDEFLKSISLDNCKQCATANKRIESFFQQVLDYFVRFKREKFVDEINKNSKFLSYFRSRCIDEFESYLQFQTNNENDLCINQSYLCIEDLAFQCNKKKDSIEQIEKDFREILKSHDITISNLGNVEFTLETV